MRSCLCFLSCWSWLTADIGQLLLELLDFLLEIRQFFCQVVRNLVQTCFFLGQSNGHHFCINLRLQAILDICQTPSRHINHGKKSVLRCIEIFQKELTSMSILPTSFNNEQITKILQEVRHKTSHVFATVKNQIEIIQGCYCIMSNQGCYIGIQGS